MSKIKISRLGPVSSFEQNVDEKLMIFIGEQASGKSTIAKTIFFCKSISEEMKKFLMDSENILNISEKTSLDIAFKKHLRTKFMEFFGTTKHMVPFIIEYQFDNQEKVTITLKNGYAQIFFSKKMLNECRELLNTIRQYYLEQMKTDWLKRIDLNLWTNQNEKTAKMINAEVNKIFGQDYTSVFIPAGRSMLATNSEFFHTLTPNKYDILMNDFIERIMILQKQYSQKMEDIVRDKKKMSSEDIDFPGVEKAMSLVKKILKGEYVNEKNGEKIYYSENEFVKLIQASSGQQESLWIVLLIFSLILNRQKVSLVIEEPEAHLFPKAQREMLELITLLINSTGSNVILTTHSPYVLTSTNLLMYSAFVEKDSEKEADIIERKYRLSDEEVATYYISNGEVRDIMDRDNHMIDASEIDHVSEGINEATDKLIEMEMKHGV